MEIKNPQHLAGLKMKLVWLYFFCEFKLDIYIGKALCFHLKSGSKEIGNYGVKTVFTLPMRKTSGK